MHDHAELSLLPHAPYCLHDLPLHPMPLQSARHSAFRLTRLVAASLGVSSVHLRSNLVPLDPSLPSATRFSQTVRRTDPLGAHDRIQQL
jgi:hypothetical protein